MTGLHTEQLTELVTRVHAALDGEFVSRGRPFALGLFGSVTYGQVIDVLVAQNRDLAATRQFFTRALEHGPRPAEVATGRAPAYPRVLDELLPSACHIVEQYG